MKQTLRISLKAARVNAGMTQEEAASALNKLSGLSVSRERIIKFEKNPKDIPAIFGKMLSEVYKIPQDCIFFG